ncbi:hypothetical protein ACRQ1B_28805 [Rhizobium panacihumi]|uniref:hypothetical protein n=1 Tax=Rhizobium panacihumi TaxID=2008450 RepID=UPI003D79D730
MIANAARHLEDLADPSSWGPTGRTRRRVFGLLTEHEYENMPIRTSKEHTVFNVDEWPRGRGWSYRMPPAA